MKLAALSFSTLLVLSSFSAPFAASLRAAPAAAQERHSTDDDDEAEQKKKREAEAKAAAEALREALEDDDAGVRREALLKAGESSHPLVVREVAAALGDDDVAVRRTAIDVLGRQRHEDALDALRRHAKRARRALDEDLETRVTLVRAIGRHASDETTEWLARGALEEESFEARQARVFAVARRRSIESLKALLDEMSRTDSRRLKNRMRELRPALVHLSGTDLGADPAKWTEWWTRSRRGFEIPEQEPELPAKLAVEWRRFWGDARTYDRRKKRGDRG